jgi:hypothetical protein
MNLRSLAAVGILAFASACTGGAEDDADSSDSAQTGSRDDYDFQLPGPHDKMVRVDAMGVALLSTVLMNRDRTPSGEDNKNQYQVDSPDVQNNPKTLVTFVTFLHRLHVYWHDHLEQIGFEPCSKSALGVTLASPCTLQKLRFDENPNLEGPRVIDAVLPDVITLDFDQPLRFPNGRTPDEPISDKVFALGFLKMGGKCPGLDTLPGVSEATKHRVPRDRNGVPICTIETFADLPLQSPKNDRPYEAGFPYLAKPWFYAQQTNAPYYWPNTSRLDLPE